MPDLPDALSDLLGAVEEPMGSVDPASFLKALAEVGPGLLRNPAGALGVSARWILGSLAAARSAASVAVGGAGTGPAVAAKGDRRFVDDAYRTNPWFLWLSQQHLLAEHAVQELLDASRLDAGADVKARTAAGFLLDAVSPSNSLLGNPTAIRRAFDTGGRSLACGFANFVDDLANNGGWPSQVDADAFEVGTDTAATPGAVVYRSHLIELIQYTPQTPRVHAVPMLFCPPWINKYYLADLAPGKSLIEWAVQHGHTCFAISYRNPDASMGGLTFADYLRGGPLDAVRVVREITGAEDVNTVSVCLGGTLTAVALAFNALTGDRSIRSATLLNTHTDFTNPGQLAAFTDEATIARLEKRMAKRGFLESTEMAHTFDVLRAKDLVFGYLVRNWLLGESPPAFDLLAWNADGTRMPATMHSQYLRSCYLRNDFAQGNFEVDGQRLDPGAVDTDTYVLSALDDHIVPWHSGYRTTQLLGGRNRFVLSTSGHIAGIVNPPSPKAKHWTSDRSPKDPEDWLAGATLHDSTWWVDWTRWVARRAGRRVPAPKVLGSTSHPPITQAPGTYVLEKA